MPELVPHLLPYVGCISHGVNVVGGEEQPRGPGLPFAFLPRGFFFFFSLLPEDVLGLLWVPSTCSGSKVWRQSPAFAPAPR